MVVTKPRVWSLSDLPELKTGYHLAFRAEGWQRPQVAIIGAETYHWEMVGERRIDDEISVGDWSAVGSIGKGISTHLLSQYQWRHMRIYRPTMPPELLDSLKSRILKRYDHYGDQKYDVKGVVMVGAWCLLHKMGFDVEWWEHNSHAFWCLEFNNIVMRDVWLPIVPDSEAPYPTNFERSPRLELIWGTF
jgi:hypothetical protein